MVSRCEIRILEQMGQVLLFYDEELTRPTLVIVRLYDEIITRYLVLVRLRFCDEGEICLEKIDIEMVDIEVRLCDEVKIKLVMCDMRQSWELIIV